MHAARKLMKEVQVNNYSDNFGLGDTDRRTQVRNGPGLGETIGAMLVTTVFGLSRGATRKSAAKRHANTNESANDEVILEASGWR